MPRIDLGSRQPFLPLPVGDSGGVRLLLPRVQLTCLVRLPNTPMPRDGIIDTGSPFTWFSEAVWSRFRPGIDYEELPFEVGYTAPRGQTAGWNFTFRMARLLQPIALFDLRTELERPNVIAQFADGNPPSFTRSNAPPRVVIGLWGGVLENTNLRISTDPNSGHVASALEW